MTLLPLAPGINPDLEEWATEILEEERRIWRLSRQETVHLDQLNDWLSPDQLQIRYDREIYNMLGFVGEYLVYRNRCFSRHYTPRDPWRHRPDPKRLTAAPSMDPWRQALWEEFDTWGYMPGHFHRRFA